MMLPLVVRRRHQWPMALSDHTSMVTGSVSDEPTCAQDRTLAAQYKMPPAQIAICRAHATSLVIQFAAFSTMHLERIRKDEVDAINQAHGRGLGDAIFQQVEQYCASMFTVEQAAANKALYENKMCTVPMV
jgi:hypothetical protein